MKRIIGLLVGVLLVTGCSGSSPNTPSSIPISIEDLDGATDVAVDSSFIYEFGKAVETSSVIEQSFYIVQNANAPDASVSKAASDSVACDPKARLLASLDVESESATLDPTDNLSAGTQYTICLVGDIATGENLSKIITYADGSEFTSFYARFTTAGTKSNLSIADTVKTSNVAMTDGEGSIDITLTFEGDASALTPRVAVYDEVGLVVESSCVFQNGSNTQYLCSVSGLDASTTLSDYSLYLTGTGIEVFWMAFNSADYEFDTTDAYSETEGQAGFILLLTSDNSHEVTAAVESDFGGITWSLTGGSVSGDTVSMCIDKAISEVDDFAVSGYLKSNTPIPYSSLPSDSRTTVDIGMYEGSDGDDGKGIFPSSGTRKESGGSVNSNFNGWAIGATFGNDDVFVVPTGGGDFSSISEGYMAPLYYCLVRKDNVVTTYVSTDGLTFTAAGTGNMECAEGSSCTVSDSTSYSLTPSALTFFVCSENDVEGEETSFTYRYMRFNVTDIEGSASDCPEL